LRTVESQGRTQPRRQEKQVIQQLIDGMILKYEARRWASRASS